MYAIIATGGKQYKVEENMLLKVEKIESVDNTVKFDALMVVDGDVVKAGTPIVEGAVVEAEIVAQDKDSKIIVYKYKAKKNERKKQGHRQPYTKVEIVAING